jgi:diguanylate cyclase (GGDEF)-like protein
MLDLSSSMTTTAGWLPGGRPPVATAVQGGGASDRSGGGEDRSRPAAGAQQDQLSELADRSSLSDTGWSTLAAEGTALFADVDRFEEVNDRGGHAVRAQLLVRLSNRLCLHSKRELPLAPMACLRGDELVAVLPGADAAGAEAIGHRLVSALVDEVEVGRRRTLQVSASIVCWRWLRLACAR